MDKIVLTIVSKTKANLNCRRFGQSLGRGLAAACLALLFVLVAHPAALAQFDFGGSGGTDDSDFIKAVEKNDVYKIHEAIVGGKSANTKTPEGEPVLELAARLGNYEAVRMLLLSGARVDSRSREGETALTSAARVGSLSIVNLLLQAGADPNIGGARGETPLIIATANGSDNVVAALIAKGADVNQQDYTGRTPLAAAEQRNYRAIAERLRAAGATL